ncbi:MAG: hypothetical protein PHW52_00745 [Candidatus Pacebacteria bacterium]|nr:hypothetical protein [Candidatus Paceibacterota bacterium]
MERNLDEYRCPTCKKLFFKANAKKGIIEIKCKNCKNIHQMDISQSKLLTINDEEFFYDREGHFKAE